MAGMQVGRRSMLEEIRKAEKSEPERTLLRWHDGHWTVADLAEHVRIAAHGLAEMGVRRGDRVALIAGNSPHTIALWYGIHAVGAVEVSVNSELRGPTLRHVLEDCTPVVVLCEPPFLDAVHSCSADVPPAHLLDDALWTTWRAAPAIDYADPEPHELASILYTSGSTGPSKGVMLPHGYFPNVGQSVRFGMNLNVDDILYFFLPMFHVDAHVIVPACLTSKSQMAFRERFSSSNYWNDVIEFGATWSVAVGSVLDMLVPLGRPAAGEGEIPLRRIAAAPISDSAYSFFEDAMGIELVEVYGQTEADLTMFGGRDRKRRGSMGAPCTGFDFAVLDDGDNELGPGEWGELAYRPGAPNMMLIGYWENPEATVAAFRNLWFHTGDTARYDTDGIFWFGGRKTDSLRHRGENISAFELEHTITDFDTIRSAAAVPMRDDFGGEDEIKVFVSLEDGHELDPHAFYAFCEQNLARFSIPRFVEVIAEGDFVRSVGNSTIQKRHLPADHGPGVIDRKALE